MVFTTGLLIVLGSVLDAAINGFTGMHIFLILVGAAITAWQLMFKLITSAVRRTRAAFLANLIAWISPIILLALVFVTVGSFAPDPKTVDEKLNSGLMLTKEGKPEDALKVLTGISSNDPLNIPARIGVVQAYLAKKDYENARIQAQDIIRFDPHQAKGYELIGDTYWGEGDLVRTIHYYKLALREDGNSFSANAKLGTAYSKTHSYGQAVQCLQRAQELAPTDVESKDLETQLLELAKQINAETAANSAKQSQVLQTDNKQSGKGDSK